MDIIRFDETQGLFVSTGIRPEFIPDDKPFQEHPEISPESHTDICHSISFYTITTGIVNALNFYIKYRGTGSQINALNYIAGMIVSVLTIPMDKVESCYDWVVSNIDSPELIPYRSCLEYLDTAIKNFPCNDDFINQSVLHCIATKASEIVRLLNSEKSNLRPGYKKWNRSLQSAYDPIAFELNSEYGFILTDGNDYIRITNLINYTIGSKIGEEKIPGAFDALFFYTFKDDENNKYVYSSNLDENLWKSVSDFEECKEPIHCINPITNEAEKIPLI